VAIRAPGRSLGWSTVFPCDYAACDPEGGDWHYWLGGGHVLSGGALLLVGAGVGNARDLAERLKLELTEHQQAQKALKASEARYQDLYDNSPDMFVSASAKTAEILGCNQTLARALGYTKEVIIGHPIFWVYHPDCMEDAKKAFQTFKESGEVRDAELQLKRKDGSKIEVSLNATAIRDEQGNILSSRAIWRDITRHKEADEALRKAQQELEQRVEERTAKLSKVNAALKREITDRQAMEEEIKRLAKLPAENPQPVLRVERDGAILYANEAAASLLKVGESKDGERLPESWQSIAQDALDSGVNREEELQHGDHTLSVLFVSISEFRYVNVYIHDITENKRVAEEIRRLNEDLEQRVLDRTADLVSANEKLQKIKVAAEVATQAKSDFLSSMSHELRTPLNAIIGFSEILSDQTFGGLNQRQLKYTNNILTSGHHLLALINDILDLSKIEAGKLELEESTVAMKSLLTDSLVMIKEKAMKHGLRLDLRIQDELSDLKIQADERKLKQIMFNLLSNAAKFTLDGGVITVEARQEEDELIVAVSDTGIGIKHDDLTRVFGEFEQLDSTYARQQQGTGLGLALTQRLVELHGGRIWAESEGEGKGSIFTFIIPIEAGKLKPKSRN